MTVLVTGGGGFLGRSLVRDLRKRGKVVRSFSRREHLSLNELEVEQRRGDLADLQAVREALLGCDLVFHMAAKVGASGRREDFHATNVRGTQNIIDACRVNDVPHLVYTSTPSVVFGHDDLEGVDETIAYPDHYEALYPQTKAAAERLILAANGDGLQTVSLRPHIVWGPGDTSLLPRLLERARAGVLRRFTGPAKKTDVTFIDDAVEAHRLAAEKLCAGGDAAAQVAGRAYFISAGQPIEIWTFIDRLLAAAGMEPIKKSISPRMAALAGWAFEKVHALRGSEGEPRLSRWIVRELSTSHWFDISAARRDLGYQPAVTIDEGLRRLAAWLAVEFSTSRAP